MGASTFIECWFYTDVCPPSFHLCTRADVTMNKKSCKCRVNIWLTWRIPKHLGNPIRFHFRLLFGFVFGRFFCKHLANFYFYPYSENDDDNNIVQIMETLLLTVWFIRHVITLFGKRFEIIFGTVTEQQLGCYITVELLYFILWRCRNFFHASCFIL